MIAHKLAFAVDNEQQHAQNLRKLIIEMNHTPFPFAFLFQLVGRMLGSLSRFSGMIFALKTDTLIERRAVKDYGYFLRALKFDAQTKSLIENIIADEELHIRNWQDSVELLKSRA